MGLSVIPPYRDHWKKDFDNGIFGNRIIQSLLSLKKFQEIHRYLHFNPNFLEDKYNENFKKYWSPKQNLAIDETMVPWDGKVKFKQYLPLKPHSDG